MATSASASTSSPFPFPARRPPDDTLFYAVYSLPLPTALPPPDLHAALRSLHLSLSSHLAPFLASHLSTATPSRSPSRRPTHRRHLPCALCASPSRTSTARSAWRLLADEWLGVSSLRAHRAFPSLAARAWT